MAQVFTVSLLEFRPELNGVRLSYIALASLVLQIEVGHNPDRFGVGETSIVYGNGDGEALRNVPRQMIQGNSVGKMRGRSLSDFRPDLLILQIHGG